MAASQLVADPDLSAPRVPRVQCPHHEVKQVSVPWARPESGFTLMFEAFVMALVREMPVAVVANVVAKHDTRLWRVVRHCVGRAHDRQDWGELRAVAVDDTATRKGHRYATVVLEIDPQQTQPARLLYRTPERTTASVGEFAAAMPAHGAKPDQVRLAAIESINSIIPRHAIAPEASATSTTSKPSATGWSAVSTCKSLQHLST